MMYSIDQIKSGFKRRELILSELNRLYTHLTNGCRYNPRGINIFEEDWDNLIILDACRYDSFSEFADLPGRLEFRISRGSTSPEFIRGNFSQKTLHDVVYISANGWYAKLKEEIDSEIHSFQFVDRDAANGLTTYPETVAAEIKNAANRYPKKRLIGHFMQPHQPFLGSAGQKLTQSRGLEKTVEQSRASRKDVIEAYHENLQLVLETVRPLIEELRGRTIVTADHGEIFGQRGRPIPVKRYGHPEAHYLEDLVKVPWHIYDPGERKEIVAEPPDEETDNFDFSAVEQHLADLGYRT